jgi:hypothetical protein
LVGKVQVRDWNDPASSKPNPGATQHHKENESKPKERRRRRRRRLALRTMADPISSSSEGNKPPSAAATETATNTRTNYVLVASYATIGILWAVSQVVLIPFYVHLIVLVTCILYAACHESIILLDKGAGDVATGEIGPDGQEIINNGPVDRETMKASDAYQFVWSVPGV